MTTTNEYFTAVDEKTAELEAFKRRVNLGGERIESEEYRAAWDLFLDVEDAYSGMEAYDNWRRYMHGDHEVGPVPLSNLVWRKHKPAGDDTISEVVAEATGQTSRLVDAEGAAYVGLGAEAIGGEVL